MLLQKNVVSCGENILIPNRKHNVLSKELKSIPFQEGIKNMCNVSESILYTVERVSMVALFVPWYILLSIFPSISYLQRFCYVAFFSNCVLVAKIETELEINDRIPQKYVFSWCKLSSSKFMFMKKSFAIKITLLILISKFSVTNH